jgi:hypothetical protein
LTGESTVFKHGIARTLYLAIPSKMASDSAFGIQMGDKVSLKWDKKRRHLVVTKE